MRLGRLSTWTSLACLGAVLTVASGCKIPTSEDQNGEGNQEDPSKFIPGPDPNQNNPGGPNTYVPGSSGIPVARKLALDLTNVAGFAILDDESQDSTQMASGNLSGEASVAPGSDMSASSIRLESNISGQVLARKIDRGALDRIAQGRLGQPSPVAGRIGASRVPGMSAEDPGANTAPPSSETTTPTPAPAPSGETDVSVGEQAGLLKITEDGEIVPALVALEPDPVPSAEPPSGDPSTPPPGTPTGTDPNGAAGTGSGPNGTAGSGSGSGTPTGTSPNGTAGSGSGSGTPTGTDPNGTPPPGTAGPRAEPLPRVTALGLSPDGSVYVLFQHGFLYRQPTAEEAAAPGFDPHSQQSPYRCQLFRADGSWQNGASNQGLAELECVTNQYEVPTWDTRRVMQFDASGKLYFRAVTPANPQGVFVQFNPTTKELSEKVNANICWRDVQVTPRGSLFYTGSTGTNGDCSGTSFFRYVSTDNRLTEIARDWWNFKYLAEQDPEDPNNERIIFYGPDPNSTGGFTWDSACLYRYNPAIATPADRTRKLVDCHRDGWAYVNGPAGPGAPVAPSDADVPGYQARCESEGQLFIGGEGVSAISQLQDGTLFVVGSFQRKLAGVLTCGLNVDADHCAVSGNGGPSDALDAVNTTQQACETAGHTWIRTTPSCSNSTYDTMETCSQNGGIWHYGGARGYQMTGPACATVGVGITRMHLQCNAPNNQPGGFSQTVEGLGYLVAATDSTPAHIQLLSDPTERVEHYWPVQGPNGAQLFYSVYSGGQYNLRMATQVTADDGTVTIERRSLLDDYEVYNLQRDPAHTNRVMFDALQFSTNNYLFGSIDPSQATPEAVQASLETVSGVSGRVETLIVLPNF
jgi:hypothetical protein